MAGWSAARRLRAELFYPYYPAAMNDEYGSDEATNPAIRSGNDSPLIDIIKIYNYWPLVYFSCRWNSVGDHPTVDVSMPTSTYESETQARREFGRVTDICGDIWLIHGYLTITKDCGVFWGGVDVGLISWWYCQFVSEVCCEPHRMPYAVCCMFYWVNNQQYS